MASAVYQPVPAAETDVEAAPAPTGLLSKIPLTLKEIYSSVDSRVNLKHVYRRLQITARILIIGTFMDDAVRVATDFDGQVRTMAGVGWCSSWGAVKTCSHTLPLVFIITQATGAFLVLSGASPQVGCLILVVWAGVHPFMYAQQANLEFLLESVTIIGGLLILLSSERSSAKARLQQEMEQASAAPIRRGQDEETKEETSRLLLVGRIALSSVFVYYSVKMINERLTSDVNKAPLEAVAYGVLLATLMIVTGLMVTGMKARWCAMGLAFIMGCAALYKHPWYITIWSKKQFTLDFVVGYEHTRVNSWLYSDHQRYFFFQQISTVGALLQLVVHGPGRYSIDEAEGPEQFVSLTVKGAD